MTTINVYLTFKGNCEKAFNFYKSVFGGEFDSISKFKEMPPDPNFPVADADMEKIMHVSFPISKETILMGSDTGGGWGPNFKQGNNFSISVGTDTKSEADRIFKGLSKGGEAVMPMSTTFWESYFGMLKDQFGINWMVSYTDPSRSK